MDPPPARRPLERSLPGVRGNVWPVVRVTRLGRRPRGRGEDARSGRRNPNTSGTDMLIRLSRFGTGRTARYTRAPASRACRCAGAGPPRLERVLLSDHSATFPQAEAAHATRALSVPLDQRTGVCRHRPGGGSTRPRCCGWIWTVSTRYPFFMFFPAVLIAARFGGMLQAPSQPCFLLRCSARCGCCRSFSGKRV